MQAWFKVTGSKQATRGRPLRLAVQEALAGYLAISLWIISFFVFTLFPLAASAYSMPSSSRRGPMYAWR